LFYKILLFIISYMKIEVLRYNVIIRREKGYYIADAPTLGVSDFGKSVDEAKKNIKEAIKCHIEGLVKTKSEIPHQDTEEFYLTPTEVQIETNFRLTA